MGNRSRLTRSRDRMGPSSASEVWCLVVPSVEAEEVEEEEEACI